MQFWPPLLPLRVLLRLSATSMQFWPPLLLLRELARHVNGAIESRSWVVGIKLWFTTCLSQRR